MILILYIIKIKAYACACVWCICSLMYLMFIRALTFSVHPGASLVFHIYCCITTFDMCTFIITIHEWLTLLS